MSVFLLFALFLFLGALQVPVAMAMCFSALAYVFVFSNLPIGIVAQRMPQQLESFPFLAVPLFVLAGNLFNRAGITKSIFAFANDLVGHVRGGLAHVNIVASVIFSGMSGVAQADAAGLGTIEIRAMRNAGYDASLSAAVTASSAIIGPIIPPSVNHGHLCRTRWGISCRLVFGRHSPRATACLFPDGNGVLAVG